MFTGIKRDTGDNCKFAVVLQHSSSNLDKNCSKTSVKFDGKHLPLTDRVKNVQVTAYKIISEMFVILFFYFFLLSTYIVSIYRH